MKNNIKRFIPFIVGVVLIVFGILMPVIFKIEYDNLSYYTDSGINNYTCSITITSSNDYEVSSATIYFENFMGDQEMIETVSSSKITKVQSGDKFTYSFVFQYDSFGEYSEFSKVSKVELHTNLGIKTAAEGGMVSLASVFKWILTAFGVVSIIIGIIINVSFAIKRQTAEAAKVQMSKTNPEINTNNMTDQEIISKHIELNMEKRAESSSTLASLFGVQPQPKEKMCEYCGSLNDANAKKCSSCGANLSKKR